MFIRLLAFYLVFVCLVCWLADVAFLVLLVFVLGIIDFLNLVLLDDPLQWRHDGRDGVLNHRCLHCLLNCWFRRRSKKISKVPVTGHCVGNSPVTGEFPAHRAGNADNVSIWLSNHARDMSCKFAIWVCHKLWFIRPKISYGLAKSHPSFWKWRRMIDQKNYS